MTQKLAGNGITRAAPDEGRSRFATLTFERDVAAPQDVLWEAWTAPAARAVWAAPTPSVTVEGSGPPSSHTGTSMMSLAKRLSIVDP